MMAFMGVRISWLIDARNVDFDSFAASASRRAACELGDVVVDRVVADMLVIHDQRDHHDLDVDQLAVTSAPPPDALDPARFVRETRRRHALGSLIRREDQIVDVAANGLLGRVAEQGGRRRVPARDDLAAIHRHHRDRTDLHQPLEVQLLAPGLGQQPIRLGEQARVLERDAHVGGQRREQPLVVRTVGVPVARPDGDDADRSIAGRDGHTQV